MKYGTSPFFNIHVAWYVGHDNAEQLLLSYGANINLWEENAISSLFLAFRSGHESIVQL